MYIAHYGYLYAINIYNKYKYSNIVLTINK